MNLVHPHYLLAALVALLALFASAWLLARDRRSALERFASPALADRLARSVSRPRRAAKLALLSLGIVAALLALARPRWGWRWQESHRNGLDILFAVDTSKSMLAEDVRPSRLARAKLAVHDLVDRFEGDRAGLVAFAGEAFLQAPVTLDRDAFGRALEALDTETIPRPGTDVGAAIREATAAFGDTGHDKVLVLLTDGESLEGDAVQAAREAARDGVRIFAVGVGGADGALVPVQGADGRPTLLRGPDGELVHSRLDEATLRQIAAVSHGDYEPFGSSGEGLRRLYERDLSTLPRHAVAERRERVWFERFQVPLAVAVAVLALEAMLGDRRRQKRHDAPLPHVVQRFGGLRRGRATVAATAVAAALVLPVSAMAQDHPPQAYNGGVSAYRAGDFAGASAGFERALRDGDLGLQARAYYNLGNARFRAGEATLAHDRAAARAAWESASRAYESALRLSPNDDDAQHNLALVRRRLAGLDREDATQRSQQQQGAQGQNGQQQGAQGQNGQQQGAQGQNGQQQGAQGQNGQQQGAQGENGQQQGAQGQNGQQQGTQGQNGQQQGAQGQNGQPQGAQGAAQGQNGQQQGAQGQNGQQQGAQGQNGQPQGAQGPNGQQQGAQASQSGQAQPRDSQGALPPQSAGSQQSPNATQPSSAGAAQNAPARGAPQANAAAQANGPQRGPSQAAAHASGPGGNVEHGGRLDARDAAELLDSMRHEERRWPLTSRSQTADPSPANEVARRNW